MEINFKSVLTAKLLLLDNGANPYLKNKSGKTVFDTQPVFCKDKSQITKMRELLKTRSAFSE